MTPPDPSRPPPDAISAACGADRPRPFHAVHQALRLAMLQTLQNVCVLDAAEARQRARCVDEVEHLLAGCVDHIAAENRFLLEPLRALAPRAALPFQHEHLDHLDGLDLLRPLLARLRDADADAPRHAAELRLRLSQFVADQLAHLAEEESTLTLALWSHFTDAELRRLAAALHEALSTSFA